MIETLPRVDPVRAKKCARQWAHDNALTLFWLHLVEALLLVILVLR